MYYLIAITSVLIAAFSQMLLKKSARMPHSSFIFEYLNPRVITAYTIMGISLVLNVVALNKGLQIKEISTIESLSYLFIPLLSYWFFKEEISKRKIFSICLIIIGIFVFFL